MTCLNWCSFLASKLLLHGDISRGGGTMGAVGADAPIKIVLAKKYTVIAPIEIRADIIMYSAWHVDCAPMMLNIFLRL